MFLHCSLIRIFASKQPAGSKAKLQPKYGSDVVFKEGLP